MVDLTGEEDMVRALLGLQVEEESGQGRDLGSTW